MQYFDTYVALTLFYEDIKVKKPDKVRRDEVMVRNEKEAMFEYDHRLNRLTKTHAYQYKNVGECKAEDEEVETMPNKRKANDPVE